MTRFKSMHDADGLRIEMAAALDNIDTASEETKAFLFSHGLSDYAFSVLLAMREALANAVIHGSKEDAAKLVTYDLHYDGSELEMRVEDQGPGFIWKRSAELSPPDTPGGRGLAILQHYFDTVTFNERGNAIVLKKHCPKGVCMSDIQQNGDTAIVKPGRDIVSSMAQDFKLELKSMVEQGVKQLTIDLEDVEMIDSIGMGLLIAAHNSLAKNGGSLRVINPSEDILRLLRTMRLDKHFIVEA